MFKFKSTFRILGCIIVTPSRAAGFGLAERIGPLLKFTEPKIEELLNQ